MPTALITGASAGLGRAIAAALAERGWRLVVDARGRDRLAATVAAIEGSAGPGGQVTALAGSVADPGHRTALVAAVENASADGGLDLLVNNASELGASPQPRLADLSGEVLRDILEVNTVAPLQLTRSLLPALVRARGVVLNITSDAAVEHYEGWGGYGASKAALDHLTGTLAAEHSLDGVAFYAVDPGDMRTDLHQAAFPGEDISDRPEPESVVAPILGLLDRRPASGRYRAAELAAELADVPSPAVAPGRLTLDSGVAR